MRVAADGVGLTQFGGVVVIMKRTRLLELPRERRRDNPMTHSSIHWILSLNWLFQRGDKCDTFSWAPFASARSCRSAGSAGHPSQIPSALA